MERRGSGMKKIIGEYKRFENLENYHAPEFNSNASEFHVTMWNLNYGIDVIKERCNVIKAPEDVVKDVVKETKPASCGTQSKFTGFQSLHNSFVEVSDESCHKQEYSILCHERFWQSIPAKAIVHVIEDAFLATTKIVDCSIIEKIPPKGVSFSDFICIFAMPFRILFVFILQH